jgi:hypothetical protein
MSAGVYYNQGSRGWLAGSEKEEESRFSSRRTNVGEDLKSFGLKEVADKRMRFGTSGKNSERGHFGRLGCGQDACASRCFAGVTRGERRPKSLPFINIDALIAFPKQLPTENYLPGIVCPPAVARPLDPAKNSTTSAERREAFSTGASAVADGFPRNVETQSIERS